MNKRFNRSLAKSVAGGAFLDGPVIAIWIVEEDEGVPIASPTFGDAGFVVLLDGGNRNVVLDELGAGGIEIVDDQDDSFAEAGWSVDDAVSEDDGAAGTWWSELDEADAFVCDGVVVEVEADLIAIEADGAVDIGDGDGDDFEFPVHREGPFFSVGRVRSMLNCTNSRACWYFVEAGEAAYES